MRIAGRLIVLIAQEGGMPARPSAEQRPQKGFLLTCSWPSQRPVVDQGPQ